MREIDVNKLDVAIEYIKRMASGNNPVNNRPAEGESVINDANVVRCLNYVADILQMVRSEVSKAESNKKRSSDKEEFPYEVLVEYKYVQDKSIIHVVKQINELIDNNIYKKIGSGVLTKALKREGLLEEKYDEKNQRSKTVVTAKGVSLGIYMEKHTTPTGVKINVNMYNEAAQNYIINNLEKLMNE